MSTTETPALTEAELKLLQALVYQECGMHFDDRRTPFLQDRLQRRLKECQLDSFYAYYRLLISQQGKQELTRLLENLTVNETSFFRNKAQLDLFQKDVLDDLLRRKQERRDYRLLHGARALHHGHAGGRRDVVLLSAQPRALRISSS
jgi:chemotaxis methyl-accepting protein methylase